MNKTKTKVHEDFKDIANSVRFYLPRVEGYQEVVRNIASKYGGMSLLEFDAILKENLNHSSTFVLKYIPLILMRKI